MPRGGRKRVDREKNLRFLRLLSQYVNLDYQEDRSAFAEAIGIPAYSVSKINLIERGAQGFTLDVLERMEAKLRIPIGALKQAYDTGRMTREMLGLKKPLALPGRVVSRQKAPPAAQVQRQPLALVAGDVQANDRLASSLFEDCLGFLRKLLEAADRRTLSAVRGLLEVMIGVSRGPTESRVFQRFSSDLPIRVKIVDGPDRYIKGRLVNISPCGAQIMTEVGLSPGTKIIGSVGRAPKATDGGGLQKPAEVLWSRVRRNGEFQYWHGVCFAAADHETMKRIMELAGRKS